jgi:alpha-glucosidase
VTTALDRHSEETSGSKIEGNLLWWKGAIIYQIYPRSFRDSNDDGIGDLAGITAGLPYISSLGVDAIWISPFYRSPMQDFGYDVADYTSVDPIFGTIEDFDRLISVAHKLGLKVIIDQIYSHTSDQHSWFQQSRMNADNEKADWYVWKDANPDGSPPTNWQSVFSGPAWEWDARRKQYYLHNFLPSQPDLNLHNPDVQEAILNVARFWLERGVDGFRIDALNFSMHDLEFRDNPPSGLSRHEITRPFDMQMHTYNQSHPDIVHFVERIGMLLREYGARFSVAEVGGPDPIAEMKAFTEGDRRLNSAYSFEFLYLPKLSSPAIKKALSSWDETDGQGWPSWAFSNHDAPRALSRWSNNADDERSAKLYMMLLLSFRGNAFIYQGEELAMPQGTVPFELLKDPEAVKNWPLTLGRDGARTPMPWNAQSEHGGFSTKQPWLPVSEHQAGRAVDLQERDPNSTLHFTRHLIAARKALNPIRTGNLVFVDAPDDLLIFDRHADGDKVRCVFNLSKTDQVTPSDVGHPVLFSTERSSEILPEKLPANSGFWVKA